MSDGSEAPSVDRSTFAVLSAFEDSGDAAYWQERSVEERLRHMELLRRINYGPHAIERLQRVLEVAPLSWR